MDATHKEQCMSEMVAAILGADPTLLSPDATTEP